MDARCIPHHSNRKHARTRVAKLSITLQHRPPVSNADPRSLVVHWDWKFGQNSYWIVQPHVAYADAKVGTIRHFSTTVLWLQQLVKRGVVTVGACTSAENRADLGDKVMACPQTATVEAVEPPAVGPEMRIR